MDGIIQDLQNALRTLKRRPGFSFATSATLALGIALVSVTFGLVNAVLLAPLPFPEPDQLVRLWEQDRDNTSFATFADWRERTRSLAGIAAVSYWTPILSGDGGAERISGSSVSANFLDVLRVRPALGRDFQPTEDRPGHNREVLLSHGLWARRFGSDPTVVGRPVAIGDTPYTVVGVMPAGFDPPTNTSDRAEIWRPLGYDATLPQACRDCRHLTTVARLRPDATVMSAQAELDVVQRALVAEYPKEYATVAATVRPLKRDLTDAVRPALVLLQGAAVFLLLIAWSNVATLFLAVAAEREREVAIRRALGASRGRILRQQLVESLGLSLLGGAVGLLLAGWAAPVVRALAPAALPRLDTVRTSPAVVMLALGLSVVCAVALALAAAAQGLRWQTDVALRAARGSSSGPGRQRVVGALVVADVALCLVLLTGAGLFGRSLSRVLGVSPGFEPQGLLTLEVTLAGKRYAGEPGETAARAFYAQSLARLRVLPGVEAVGMVSQLPLGGDLDRYGIHAQDRPSANPAEDPEADRYSVDPDYLRTMRIPLRRGRTFTTADDGGAVPVVLVSETLAGRVWSGEDPVGKAIRVGGDTGPWRTVVGVVGDVRHAGLEAAPTPQVYLPYAQWSDTGMVVVVRARTDPASLTGPVRGAIAAVDGSQALSKPATMREVVGVSTAHRRFLALMAGLAAAIAVALAAIGIGGVVARSVTSRTREIGIRLALGAWPAQVRLAVLARTFRLAALGGAAGLAGALGLGPLVSGLLFGVAPRDVAVIAGAVLVLAVTIGLAALLPAGRAAAVDPMVALRED